MGFTNNKTDKILEFKNRGIRVAAGTVFGRVKGNPIQAIPISANTGARGLESGV